MITEAEEVLESVALLSAALVKAQPRHSLRGVTNAGNAGNAAKYLVYLVS